MLKAVVTAARRKSLFGFYWGEALPSGNAGKMEVLEGKAGPCNRRDPREGITPLLKVDGREGCWIWPHSHHILVIPGTHMYVIHKQTSTVLQGNNVYKILQEYYIQLWAMEHQSKELYYTYVHVLSLPPR